MKRILVSALLTAIAAVAQGEGVTTNVVTYLDENASIIWRTITEAPARIALDWPRGSASAVLTAKVGVGQAQSVVLTDTTTNSCYVAFVIPDEHKDRNVVELSISYRDAEDAEISSSSVRLGLVDGVGQGASIPVSLDGSSITWRRFEGHEVVQIPPDATGVTLDGEPVDCDIPGWYCLNAASGSHTLAWTSDSGTESATVVRGGGFIMIVY